MPTQYAPAVVNTDTNKAGTLYHVVIGDGTRAYGYMLQNWGGSNDKSALNESTDINSRDKLIQFSSPSLIDQHLVNYPRVSQGDFSGGGLQVVFLDATKFFDSDLDINTPGYLQLRPSWFRQTRALVTPGTQTQAVAFGGDVYYTFSESNGNTYKANLPGGPPTVGQPDNARGTIALDTEGGTLQAGTTNGIFFLANAADITSWTAITSSINNAPAKKWWIVNQGTNGRFAYYSVQDPINAFTDDLFKVDLSLTRPIAAGSQPQVATNNTFRIVDVVAYQNGIAILTTDSGALNGFDVWFHDGVNMTRIIRVDSYVGRGMCAVLGDLYVGAQANTLRDSPILARISSGNYEIVARPGKPGVYGTSQFCGQPVSGGEYVYWPVQLASQGLSTAPYVIGYNVRTGAVGHLPNFGTDDFGTQLQGSDVAVHRNIDPFGLGVVAAWQASPTSGIVQIQSNSVGAFTYASSGWVVGSKFDFGTPGVPKRFRRVEVHHVPLNAGESMTLNAYVDLDPLAWTPSLAPVPSTATVTNSTVGSAVTVLTVGNTTTQGNVGRSVVPAAKLTAGTNQQTSPKIIYWAVEVGGTLIWDFDLNCTSTRRLLQPIDDPQGVTGKDLYFMLRNAYENGTPLTLTLAGSLSYTVNIESMKAQAFGYVQHQGTPIKADEEWLVHVTLRQEAS